MIGYIGKYETNLDKRILAFIEKAPKFRGDPKEVFEWCEKLENHFSNYKWQTNEAMKRMLLSCITGSARHR